MSSRVPFLDLRLQNGKLRSELDAALGRVLDGSQFILGPEVTAFEEEFRAYLGAGHAVGIASGTDALHLSLRALGVGPGDEVIVPAFTFAATASAVRMAGATPVLADIDLDTFLLDPSSAAACLGPRTRAVIPVHLFGRALDLEPLRALGAGATSSRIDLVEDAAQAHGAHLPDGRRAGTAGAVGCFSFYPTKNLGGAGDAGMAVTADPELAERLRRLRHHGQSDRYLHVAHGFAARLDALQAAVLRSKLPHLEGWNSLRRRIAGLYEQGLKGLDLMLPPPPREPGQHVHHTYVVRSPRREELRRHLEADGIETAVYYPIPLHRQPAFRDLGRDPAGLPRSERAAAEVLSLPLYPELSDAAVERVIASVRRFHDA